MSVITLCGSTRFKATWLEWNKKLTLQGNVVHSVAIFRHDPDVKLSQIQLAVLDSVHLAKIKLSEEIFVLDVDGYIGEGTRREIAYAQSLGIAVNYLSGTPQ